MILCVGNLNKDTIVSEIRGLFEPYGPSDIKVLADPGTSRSRCIAYISLPEELKARKAIKDLNGLFFMGFKIIVSAATVSEIVGIDWT